MYLINDDRPDAFEPRILRVIRNDFRICEKAGLVVHIEPAVTVLPERGPLKEAVLVARHRDVDLVEIARGIVLRPSSVFVCRFKGRASDLPRVIKSDALTIEFWGRVVASASLESLETT